MAVDARTLRGPGEVAEDEAPPGLRATYDEIARLLGVPFVPTIYRMLGHWPAYLAAAVEAIGPRLAGPEADAFAAAARERAAAATAELPGDPIPAGADAQRVLAVLDRYNAANPRSAVFAAALLPGVPEPPGLMAPTSNTCGPSGADAILADVRARHGGLVLPGVWRELAGTPAVLEAAWRRVRPLAGVPAFHEARAAVHVMAVAAAGGTEAPRPEACGVPDADVPKVAAIAGWFAHGIPAVVVEIEHLRRLVRS